MACLQQVAGADDGQSGEQRERDAGDIDRGGNRNDDEEQRRREQDAQRVADEAGRECEGQHLHESSPLDRDRCAESDRRLRRSIPHSNTIL
jgi:hypothetical protein